MRWLWPGRASVRPLFDFQSREVAGLRPGSAGVLPIQASTFNPFTNIAPFAPGFSFDGVSFVDPFGSAGVTNPFPAQYGPRVPGPEATFVTPTELRAVFSPDFRTPLLTQWHLALERELPGQLVLRLGYIGNKGTYFFAAAENSREINPAIFAPGATVANTQARRPYRDYSRIGYYESGNNSSYHSMVINVERRFAKGLSLLANYTWSAKFDDYGWSNPSNRRFDYGRSREDVPHNFKFSNVWQVPAIRTGKWASAVVNGWMMNSILTWQSGFPFTISSGRDNSFTGIGRDRADFLGGNAMLDSGRAHGELITRYFDTLRFAPNAVGTFGNSGRNILSAPRYFNADVGFLKHNRISERVSLQVRAEFFNLFNNVVFNGPNTNQSAAQFGRITSALDSRIGQVGMKLLF